MEVKFYKCLGSESGTTTAYLTTISGSDNTYYYCIPDMVVVGEGEELNPVELAARNLEVILMISCN